MQRTWSYHHHHLIILFKDQERAEVCLLKGQWWKPLVIVCPDLSHREKKTTSVFVWQSLIAGGAAINMEEYLKL